MHSARIASRNTSRLRLASTQPRIFGTTKRATTTVPDHDQRRLAQREADAGRGVAQPVPPAPSSGTISTIGTTHRS